MATTRAPTAAGLFYPKEAAQLGKQVFTLLRAAPRNDIPVDRSPKAVIVPSDRYSESGQVAAAIYDRVIALRYQVTRVVLLAQSQDQGLGGIVAPACEWFETPLGALRIDSETVANLSNRCGITINDLPHAKEHAIEVQLPFVQVTLGEVALVPLLVGKTTDAKMDELLDACWGNDETLIIVCSDLGNHHIKPTTTEQKTTIQQAIENLESEAITDMDCGDFSAITALLRSARNKALRVDRIAVQPGSTADPDRSVSFGAWEFYEPSTR